jgi:hypothetical protein
MPRALPNTEEQRNVTPGEDLDSAAPDTEGPALASARFQTSAPVEDQPAPDAGPADADEVEQLRAENAALQRAVGELQQLLEEGSVQGGEAPWLERQKEYESLLDEKSEVIRGLHAKILELQQQPRPAPATPREEELLALSDELERERCQLDQERRQLEQERNQLKADEADLMKQMRDMEVQMARERAELARQRNEVQRLHSEIRHELELASRDATLRERLMPLQRRHQDMVHRKGVPPAAPPQAGGAEPSAPQGAASKDPKAKDSGLLGRFFGQGGR